MRIRRRKTLPERMRLRWKAFILSVKRLNLRARLILAGIAVLVVAGVVLAIVLPGGEAQTVAQVGGSVETAPAVSASPSDTASPEPSEEPSPTPTPDPTLKKGDESDRVQELQERLMDLGYMDLDESTKLFGPATEYAVELFQRQNKMQQDGIAGSDTLNLIFSDDAQKYMLLEGTRGEDVDSLQRQLTDLGYLGHSTGYYGTETIAAVKEFQKRNNLAADGKTGEKTLALIYSPKAKVSATKANEKQSKANIDKMIEVAQKQLGKRYVLGNEGPSTFDCSGLVYYCLKQAGSSRGRYNAAGYSQVSGWTKISSMSKMQRGDLIFYWHTGKTRVGHVGIYIGNGMMIDASSANGKVVKRSCTTAYWKKMFVTARRPW